MDVPVGQRVCLANGMGCCDDSGVAALVMLIRHGPSPSTLAALASVLHEGSARHPFAAEAVRIHLHCALIGVAGTMQQPGDGEVTPGVWRRRLP